MATSVLSGSRAGAGSPATTAAAGGTRHIVGVGVSAAPVPPVVFAAALRATSRAAAVLAVTFPPTPANLLSPSRPGVRGSAVVALPAAQSLPGHGHGRPLIGIGAYPIVGIGVAAVTSLPPSVATLAGAMRATSRAAGNFSGVVSVSLAGQITASSRGGARFPSTVSLTGRITAQSKGSILYAPPPNVVLTSWLRAASSAGIQATLATVRTQQDAVTVISG